MRHFIQTVDELDPESQYPIETCNNLDYIWDNYRGTRHS